MKKRRVLSYDGYQEGKDYQQCDAFEQSYFSNHIPTEGESSGVDPREQTRSLWQSHSNQNLNAHGNTKDATKLNETFELLRRREYEEYLEEFDALRAIRRGRFSCGPPIENDKPQTFNEFLKNPRVFRNERYQHYFKFGIFMKFLFAHLMFFLFGPLGYPLLIPLFGLNQLYNMGFYGWNRSLGVQTFQWIAFIFPLVIAFSDPDSGFYISEMMNIFAQLALRSIVVAIRYGYASHSQLFIIKHVRRTAERIGRDFSATNWQTMDELTAQRELEISLLRTKIDPEFFIVTLADPLSSQAYIRRLHSTFRTRSTLEQDLKGEKTKKNKKSAALKMHQQNSLWIEPSSYKNVNKDRREFKTAQDIINEEAFPSSSNHGGDNGRVAPRGGAVAAERRTEELECSRSPIPGRNIAREILLDSRQGTPKMLWILVFLYWSSVFVPFIVRGVDGIAPFGDTPLRIAAFICFLIGILFATTVNAYFYTLAAMDSSRRFYLLRSLTSMISVHKDCSFVPTHEIPLMDLYEERNLLSWYKLRNLFSDVGKRFSDRLYVFFSICVLSSTFSGLYVLMNILGIFQVNQQEEVVQISVLVFWGFGMLIPFSVVLYNGASINELFKKHRDILRMNHRYYREAQSEQCNLSADTRYLNPMLMYAAERLAKVKSHKAFDENIRNLAALTEELYEKLEIEEKTRAYKILGIKVDWTLASTIGTVAVSIIGALVQYSTGGF